MKKLYLSFSRLALAAGLLLGAVGTTQAQVANYAFSQSQGTYTPITGGTLLSNAGADDQQFNNTGASGTTSTAAGPGYPIGFTFMLDGVAYDRFAINNNGWIALGNSSGGSAAVSALKPYTGTTADNYRPLSISTAQPYPIVAAFAINMRAQAANSLRFQTVGTAPNQTLVVQWENYTLYTSGNGSTLNFQIRLSEGSDLVQLAYGFVTSSPVVQATVQAGLHGTGGTDVVGRANTATSATAWTTTVPFTASTTSIPLWYMAVPPSGLQYAFAPSTCTPPTATAISAITPSSASVSFGKATGISTYTVTLTPQNGTPTVVTSTASGSPVTLSGLTPGTLYTAQVASNCSNGTLAAGTAATFTTTAANDECATALPLAVNATCSNTAVSTIGVTSSPSTLPTGGCSSTSTPDVWYRLTVPASGGLAVTSSALAGSSTRVVAMELYFGSCTGLIPLACTSGNGTFGTLAVRNQTPGDQLYLRVRTNDGTNSMGSFNLCAVAAPTNDDPAGAQALALGTACTPVTTSNVAATTTTANGYGNPGTCGIATSPIDVWYSFRTNPSGTGPQTVRVIVNGSAAGLVRLFSAASSAGPFTQVSCSAGLTNNTPAAPLRVTTLAPNTQYFLSVAGYSSTDATGAFTICVQDQTVTATRAALGGQPVEVYPNPAVAGRATLRLPAHGAGQVTLLNALGQAVRTQAVAGASAASEIELNVAGLAAGLYSVRVRAGAETAVLRLAVE